MRAPDLMRAFVVALPLAATASCVLVTGSTDGYELATDASATTPPDAGTGLQLECLSTSNCAADGGAADGGAAVCCVTALSASSARAACQAAPCGGALPVQLCASDAECGGLGCVLQACTLAGASAVVRACGTIPTCTPR